jgi:hypothetical protein
VPAILRALGRAVRRDLGTFGSIKVNNFFLFVALLIWGAAVSGVAPVSAYPFLVLLGVLMLFPLSGDPLAKIPPSRLGLWPLAPRQRLGLRTASLAFSPILWLAAVMLLKTGKAAALLAIPLGLHGLAAPRWNPLRRVPPIPGRLGELVRSNIREMLTLLDAYLAIAISLASVGYRFFSSRPDPAAYPFLAMLVALALSTYAQCLFSLDARSGETRYRLLPLAGWQILAAKDAAFLAVLLPLVLLIDPAAGLLFGLTALAIGRYPAVALRLPVERWRFTSGRILFGVLQVLLGAVAAFAAQWSWPLVVLAYMASVWWGGPVLLVRIRDCVVRE